MKKISAMLLCVMLLLLTLTGCDSLTDEQKALFDAKVGDTITLGKYCGEALEWQVLKAEDGELLLITTECIEARVYNSNRIQTTWEDCGLRRWLNEDFYDLVFTDEDKKLVAKTKVVNDDNPTYDTEGGNDTEDYVFLLSIAEANEYFASDADRVCVATEHAMKCGDYVLTEDRLEEYQEKYDYPLTVGAGVWWLRSPGYVDTCAARVDITGSISEEGYDVDGAAFYIRPVIVLKH